MFILGVGDVSRSVAAGGDSQEARRLRELATNNKKDKKEGIKEELKAPEKPKQLTSAQIYQKALTKTLKASKDVSVSHTELPFKEGLEVAAKNTALLTEQQQQVYKTIKEPVSTASAKGLSEGLSAYAGQKIESEIRTNKNFALFERDAKDTAKKVILAFFTGEIKDGDLLKHFANDAEASKVLRDPEKLKQVLFIVQEATDEYMNDVRTKMADPRRTVQQKAQDALDIATEIIKAEKKIREQELYNMVGLKSRGLGYITDA